MNQSDNDGSDIQASLKKKIFQAAAEGNFSFANFEEI